MFLFKNISTDSIPKPQPKLLNKEELLVVERAVFDHIINMQDTIASRLQSPKQPQLDFQFSNKKFPGHL
jgi:hypothetical protein